MSRLLSKIPLHPAERSKSCSSALGSSPRRLAPLLLGGKPPSASCSLVPLPIPSHTTNRPISKREAPHFACKFGLCHHGNTLTTEIFVAGDRRTGEVASGGGGKGLKAPRRGFFLSQTSLPVHRLHRVLTAHVNAGWWQRDECNSTVDSLHHFQASIKFSGWLALLSAASLPRRHRGPELPRHRRY